MPAAATQTAVSADRERLILEHLPQVRLIARRIHERLPGVVCLEDLVSSGTIGLIAAIDRYDEEQGVKLRTYAEFKIRGAILDSLRELDWAPRRQRRRARALNQARTAVENRTKTTASTEEIAQELGLSLSECLDWIREARSLSVESMDEPVRSEDGGTLASQIPANPDLLPSRTMEECELRELLADAIRHMPRQERTVLSLIFHEDLSLREIAKVMGLHESRISQIKLKALERMRGLMEKRWSQKGAGTKCTTRPRQVH